MKKLLLLLLLLTAISILLSSCKVSGNNEADTSKTDSQSGTSAVTEESTTLSPQSAKGVARQIENGRFDNFNNYSDEDKALIKESVEKDGYTLEYNSDGTATLSNEEGSWFIGTGWADNEYTKGLPAPDFGTVTMSAEDEEKGKSFYIFLIKNATARQAADYVEKLEDSGFESTQEKTVDIDNNVVVFYGKNSNGKIVELGYTHNGLTIKIYK
ncbi:MAG: hypothetical protein IJU45_08175 [Clostridia bacterium]|nr:hypothetical protein [Clostridia bacterium]